MGGGLILTGKNIELYYGVRNPADYQNMMSKPKESIGDTGAFVTLINDGNTPVIVAPETSYIFNYDFVQVMSPIRSLTRKMPKERLQISHLDNDLYYIAADAYSKLIKKDK